MLSKFVALSLDEEQAIRLIPCTTKRFAGGDTLVREGKRPAAAFLLVSGIAYRYRHLANGKRQIFGYLLPGDLCDVQFMINDEIDHDIGLLTDAEVAMFSAPEIMHCGRTFPNIRQAFLKMMRAESASLHEWLLNAGQRSAPQRLAHFICEISGRLHELGQVNQDGTYFIPLTQIEIADTMGMTVVHVSRCMQQFRRNDLVQWSKRQLNVMDADGLRKVADLDGGRIAPALAEPLALAV